MTTAELAWLAGLIEGEGCFTTHLNNAGQVNKAGVSIARRRPLLLLMMTDEDVVRRAHEISGMGHVTGPYQGKPRDVGGAIPKPVWAWRVSKKTDVLFLLRELRPFMGQRRGAKIDEILSEFGRPIETEPPDLAA